MATGFRGTHRPERREQPSGSHRKDGPARGCGLVRPAFSTQPRSARTLPRKGSTSTQGTVTLVSLDRFEETLKFGRAIRDRIRDLVEELDAMPEEHGPAPQALMAWRVSLLVMT